MPLYPNHEPALLYSTTLERSLTLILKFERSTTSVLHTETVCKGKRTFLKAVVAGAVSYCFMTQSSLRATSHSQVREKVYRSSVYSIY